MAILNFRYWKAIILSDFLTSFQTVHSCFIEFFFIGFLVRITILTTQLCVALLENLLTQVGVGQTGGSLGVDNWWILGVDLFISSVHSQVLLLPQGSAIWKILACGLRPLPNAFFFFLKISNGKIVFRTFNFFLFQFLCDVCICFVKLLMLL